MVSGSGENVCVGVICARSRASVNSFRVCSSRFLASVNDRSVCEGFQTFRRVIAS